VGVACDLGYPCAKFRLPRPFAFRVRADVRDIRRTDRRTDGRTTDADDSLMPRLSYRGGGMISVGTPSILFSLPFLVLPSPSFLSVLSLLLFLYPPSMPQSAPSNPAVWERWRSDVSSPSLGERCKLPNGVRGGAPAANAFLTYSMVLSPPRCNKCNSRSINSQCTNFIRII